MRLSTCLMLVGFAAPLASCGGGGLTSEVPGVQPMVASAVVSWATTAGGAEATTTFARAAATHSKGWSVVVGSMNAETSVCDRNGKTAATLAAPDGTNCSYVVRYETDGSVGWTRCIHGDSTCDATAVAVTSDAAIVVTGFFSGSITLSDKDLGEDEVTLSSNGKDDAFVARYTADGALVWGVCVGSSGTDQGLCVCATNDGTAVVGGVFAGSVTFGAGESKEKKLTSSGAVDGFLAKYDTKGALVWARAFQSESKTGYSVVWAVASDSDSNIAAGGGFTGKGMTVDSTNSNDKSATALTSASTAADVFAAKFDKDGARAWQVSAGGEGKDELYGITISPNDGAVLLTGGFYGKAAFGSTTLDTTDSTAENAFIACYDKSGKSVWATQADGPVAKQGSVGLSIAADSNGGAVVVGFFSGTISGFGGSKNKLTSQGAHDVFLVRFNPGKSTVDWAMSTGGGSDEAGITGVSIVPAKKDAKQSVVMCGYYTGSATFGLGETNETTLSGKGTCDAYVVRFTPDGK